MTSLRHPGEQPLRPKKSLGQNFLRDENICRNIVSAFNPAPSDLVLEIGPGEGALTKYLVPAVRQLIVVDIDERVILRMRALFPDIEIIHKDVLALDMGEVSRARERTLRVIGNIPYNITTPLLFHILDYRAVITDATLMMQKEVAQRLVARPRTKDYGILAVFIQLFADVELLFDVSGNAFYPKPDVTSSVLHFVLLTRPRYDVTDEKVFRSMVRSVFGKRRKMLRGSLKSFCDTHGYRIPEREFDLTRRPEELSIEELVRLSNVLVFQS